MGEADRTARVEWLSKLIEHGYWARTIPKAYGGYGAEPDLLESRIIAEEFAAARVSPGLGGQGLGGGHHVSRAHRRALGRVGLGEADGVHGAKIADRREGFASARETT